MRRRRFDNGRQCQPLPEAAAGDVDEVAMDWIRVGVGDFDRPGLASTRPRHPQRVRPTRASNAGARCGIARPTLAKELSMNPDTATASAAATAFANAADHAHRAVDRAREKATPAVERAASVAHRTIDNV